MRMIELGGSELPVSTVAMGCMRIAELEPKKLEALVETALASGVNFFDHADIYGGGNCEKRFGDLLKHRPELREKMVIQSKCGIRPDCRMFDFSREHILFSVDCILKRLKIEQLDVLLLHRPDALMEPEEVADAFTKLHDGGKVRYFGVSNQNREQIELLQSAVPYSLLVNQLQFGPAHTTLLDSGFNVNLYNESAVERGAGIIEFCRRQGMTIQAWSPFLYGFFEGVFFNSPDYRELVETLGVIGERHGISAQACVIAWMSRHPAQIQTILGTTNPDRLADCCRGSVVRLSREEWYEIYRSAGNRLP